MSIWQIILIILVIISCVFFIVGAYNFFKEWKEKGKPNWGDLALAFFFIPALLFYFGVEIRSYLEDVWEDGGFIRHYRKIRERKEENARREEEYNRIKSAYESGELRRNELPRALDGIRNFEVYDNLLDGDEWRDLVYIENKYNNVLNDFFKRHPVIHLKHGIRIIYLPLCVKGLTNEDVLMYWNPGYKGILDKSIGIDTSSLLDELCYPEDAAKLTHGLISCFGWGENHGAKFVYTSYYPLKEADDRNIMQQIENIAKEAFEFNELGFYSTAKRPSEDKQPTDDFADEQFNWEIRNLVDEIRERVEKLEQRGISRKLLMKLFTEKPELSRLVITKDMRIVLPDYNNMEIKMEPINKAVFLLFLRHPEGIVFKHLPNYKKELAAIYQKIKPLGLNDRALQSIEDVTNPTLNSINEKCARIRGSFVSQFDDSLARHYYIYGMRGEPKKIDLPRNLVIWE
jgi:hypothetical protein